MVAAPARGAGPKNRSSAPIGAGMTGGGGIGPLPMERMSAFKAQAMDAGGGAPLSLSPEQIQVSSSVDVRFTTA